MNEEDQISTMPLLLQELSHLVYPLLITTLALLLIVHLVHPVIVDYQDSGVVAIYLYVAGAFTFKFMASGGKYPARAGNHMDILIQVAVIVRIDSFSYRDYVYRMFFDVLDAGCVLHWHSFSFAAGLFHSKQKPTSTHLA